MSDPNKTDTTKTPLKAQPPVAGSTNLDTNNDPIDPNAGKKVEPNKAQRGADDIEPTPDNLGDTVHGVTGAPYDPKLVGELNDKGEHPLHGDLGKAEQVASPDDNRPKFGPNGEPPLGDSNARQLLAQPNPFLGDDE
jgi:hypothetical protein